MKIVTTKRELSSLISEEKKANKTIGLVPTMGALHQGHLTLVKKCRETCNITVVSIFVNPRQFNNPEDLQTYPRQPEKDLQMLESVGVDYVFMPSVEDIYDNIESEKDFHLGALAKVMEGVHRPGHFEGVVQIVTRLFDIVQPTQAFFGEKDFQQLAIIQYVVKEYNYPIEIVPVAIVRESNGLALSSRNQRLSAQELHVAPTIYQTLQKSKEMKEAGSSLQDVKAYVVNTLNAIAEFEVEYFEIADSTTLQPLNTWNESKHPIGCIACYCGAVRLIDNIKY